MTLYWLLIALILLSTIIALLILQRLHKEFYLKSTGIHTWLPPYKKEHITYSIILIGDTGAIQTSGNDPLLAILKQHLLQCGSNSAVIFLGDNIYPYGLPEIGHKWRKKAEERINVQLDAVKDHDGRVYFISGNHDWDKGREGGLEYVLRQEEYIRDYTGRWDIYQPTSGCMGPVEIQLAKGLKLVFINTQWFIQEGERPLGKKNGCDVESEEEFFDKLENSLKTDDKLLIAGHHPLYSNSAHGGKFSYKFHFFPLTSWKKKLYIPIPLIGSLYPLYRRFRGPKEDMSHPAYRNMRKKLLRIFKKYSGLIYASGHDHNLQYLRRAGLHFLISGSGSHGAYVRKGGSAVFADSRRGFIQLNYLQNSEIWLEAWVIQKHDQSGLLAFVGKIG